MGWKKLIFGEKMPDKEDPKYKERYEKEVETGRNFARVTRIDKVAAAVQCFANGHRNLFLAIVFGTVILCFTYNIYRVVQVCNAASQQEQTTSAQKQEKALKKLRGKDRMIKELEMKYEKLLKEKTDSELQMNTNNQSKKQKKKQTNN